MSGAPLEGLRRRIAGGPPDERRPVPSAGDRVAYAPEPGLWGVMLLVAPVVGAAGMVFCEVDPPERVLDGYEPRVEMFALEQLVHAGDVFVARQVTQTGLPGR